MSSSFLSKKVIKSSERPELVVTFLKDAGLSHDQIKAVVSFCPLLLGYNVEKTLKPKVRELMDGGFSGEVLVHLIRYNPSALVRKNTLSRLLFWRNFAGNNDEVLLKILQRNTLLFTHDIGRCCLGQNLDSLRQSLELIEEHGISRGSRMFVNAFKSVGGYNEDKIKKKVEFLMVTYGWSEEDVCAAFRKFPRIFAVSEDKVKTNMDFLIRKAGFEPREIALQPVLLGCSVQTVLIPRYTVLSALQAKGLKKKYGLLSAAVMSESNFLERYVVPHEKDVPGLAEAYAAAGGKIQERDLHEEEEEEEMPRSVMTSIKL